MKEIDGIKLIASNMSSNTMEKVFPYIASDCTYYSDLKKYASNKEEVCRIFTTRKNAMNREKVEVYAYPAKVESSDYAAVSVGTNCIAVSQFDRYNCVGFMTIQINFLGKIKEFSFHTSPKVKFKTDAPGKFNIERVPSDAHDAIGYRAFALGIMNEKVKLSKHIQRYDVFHEYVDRVYQYIYRYLMNDFRNGITNAAGYLYVTAMAEAVKRERGITLSSFDEAASTTGEIITTDLRYHDWMVEGFKTGKLLFRGFTEYVDLRKPDEITYTNQLLQSYLDMTLYGSVQANRDMDQGIPTE